MNHLKITIRNERRDDYPTILRLTYEAFLTLTYPEKRRMDEHSLIHLLQNSAEVVPELCYVAEYEGEIVGHILYTRSRFRRPDGSEADAVTFGPLSVSPMYHRQGIGKALVMHSMEKAREMGFGAVLIVGVPDYYPKLGFKRARDYGLSFADGSAIDPFMAYELAPGYLTGGGVYHCWAPEFDMAEHDDVGYEAFNKQFMREYFPGQLKLRPLFESDIPLMERWLNAVHVAPWYRPTEDWLHEINCRFSEFSFITHLIAELDGEPLGFCQYYDCFDAKEEWYATGRPKAMYSIDYMVGEPKYLQRGFGKEMIRVLLEILCKVGAREVVVQPDQGNVASVRSLLANGFVKVEDNYSFAFK